MRSTRWAIAFIASFALGPVAAEAQRQNCDLSYAGSTNTMYGGTPNEMSFLGGGVRLVCDRGTTIAADSAVRIALNNRLEFIRNVRYADSARTLRSDYLQYLGQDRLIVAQGNVVLRERATGSTLTGPFLSYYLATDTRPEEIVQMPQGRPEALLVRAVPDTAGGSASDTTHIVANLIEIVGESRFIGRGNVEIERSELRAFGSEVNYVEADNEMRLSGQARVEGEDYTLHGDTIVTYGESGGGDFREVVARQSARLLSEELTVEAPGIHVYFADGEVDRLVALGDTLGGRTPAVAISPEFRLEADSIDAIAPDQKLETVTAVGRAYGVRTVEDSLAAERPELIRHDWVRGDTIVAWFADPPPPLTPTDTAQQRVLERLDALGRDGAPASSLYRMRNGPDENSGFAVNYLRARRIAVYLEGGEVTTVEADDAVHGLYLRPPGQTGGTGNGTEGRTGGADRR